MIQRPSKKRALREPEEAIHIMALWNLMIILIPFLLLSAVFSRTSILNIYLPEPVPEEKVQGKTPDTPQSLIIVSILKDGFIIHDGERVLAAVPKTQEGYNFEGLSTRLVQLKGQVPQQEEIILLSEPDVRYETIIQTMDASREGWMEQDGKKKLVSLFPRVSIGEVGQVTFREVLQKQ